MYRKLCLIANELLSLGKACRGQAALLEKLCEIVRAQQGDIIDIQRKLLDLSGSSPHKGANRVGTNVPTQPSVPPMPPRFKRYLLGKDSELMFDTGYIPEEFNYFDNTAVFDMENSVVMTVILADKEKEAFYMSAEQARAIIEALQMQIDRLGGVSDE